jgi:hypothetical protein
MNLSYLISKLSEMVRLAMEHMPNDRREADGCGSLCLKAGTGQCRPALRGR